ncbi:alpha-amylase family glycosyl hydrolase [Nannocystis pusilla]|uniref:alpha-amylase family glycosyl hydrolase n=1 Tax=Nannocystis pusilla TaxID=889268 RepID=UPI003B791A07
MAVAGVRQPGRGPRGPRDGHLYEGYHGYWPLDSRGVDSRIGGEAALRSLVTAAHARGLRVLLDLVPNHVYEDNPRYRESQAQELWNMSDPPCVCGLGSCDWGRYIQTCWFTPYLPDVRLERPEALRWAYEDAVWWTEAFDLDGLRVDAVPMMPRAATRRIAAEVRERLAPREASFFVGEVFTGPGRGDRGDPLLPRARRARQRVRLPADVGAARRDRPRVGRLRGGRGVARRGRGEDCGQRRDADADDRQSRRHAVLVGGGGRDCV